MIGTRILEQRSSKFNSDIKVVKTLGLGTYIQVGGLTQSGGIVEKIWNQTLKKIKREREEISNCLILGFGGGTVFKIGKKLWPQAKFMGVDIDPVIIDLGKKYLDWSGDVDLKIGDALGVSRKLVLSGKKYELIVIDLYCGDKFPDQFENEKFIYCLRKILGEFGIIVFNRLYYGEKRPDAVRFGKKLEKIFEKVEWFYPQANVMLICT